MKAIYLYPGVIFTEALSIFPSKRCKISYLYSGIPKMRRKYFLFPQCNKWKLFICMDQLDKNIIKTPTHTGKQSEKSLGAMLFPMEGSHEYDKTI